MQDEELVELAYVISSGYRVTVLKALDNRIETPTSIAKKVDISPNHVSRVLSELKNHEIIECINEDAHKTRLYRLTDLGEKILDNLDVVDLG